MSIRRRKNRKQEREKKPIPNINENIRARRVLLVTEEGSREMSRTEAIALAEEQNLDLVQVGGRRELPACKILNYSKYQYEQKKQAREAARKQKEAVQEQKEIRLLSNIAEHDLKTKAKAIDRFLANNDKVRISLKLRGRESRQLAIEKIRLLQSLVDEPYEGGKKIEFEGRFVNVLMFPPRKGKPSRNSENRAEKPRPEKADRPKPDRPEKK